MRLIVWSIILNVCAGVLGGLAFFGLALAPMFFFGSLESGGFWLGLSIFLGSATYVASTVLGIVYLFLEYSGRPAQAVGNAVENAIDYVAAMESIGIIRAWFKAMHDKSCPHINFTS